MSKMRQTPLLLALFVSETSFGASGLAYVQSSGGGTRAEAFFIKRPEGEATDPQMIAIATQN
jgi:hypothetical protein